MLSERAAAVSEKTSYLCVENFPLTGYIRPMKRRVYLDHLSGTPLHDGIAHSNLAVAAHGNMPVFPDGKHCGRTNFWSIHWLMG